MKMNKTIILVISIFFNIWFANTIIHLERFHYSVQVGMCDDSKLEVDRMEWLTCNETTETRTKSLWHLFYALQN